MKPLVLLVFLLGFQLSTRSNETTAVPLPFHWEETFSLTPGERMTGDLLILTREAHIEGEVSDDLFLLTGFSSSFSRPSTNAGLARISGFIRGTLWAAGTRLVLDGEVERHVRAAFQTIQLGGRVDGNAWLAGETVTITPQAMIGGNLRTAAGQFILRGTVDGHLAVKAREIVLDGIVNGSAALHADKITILAGSQIHGPLDIYSPQPVIPSRNAAIEGPIRHVTLRSPNRWTLTFVSFSALLLLALFLSFVTPPFVIRPVLLLEFYPWKSLAFGLGALILIPLLALLAFLSLMGIPLSLLLGALYLLGLMSGKIVAAFMLGRLLTGNRGQPLIPMQALPQLLLGLFLFQAALLLPPPFSNALWLWFTATGLGGMILALRPPRTPLPPPPIPSSSPNDVSPEP